MRILIAVLISVSLLALLAPGAALAQDNEACPHHNNPTIETLRACVGHHIDNAGVTKSLLAKLDAAQKALDQGQPSVAVNILRAFVQEVGAQSGKHIETHHAEHLIAHAQNVITTLNL